MNTATEQQEYLFDGVYHALSFAYRFNPELYSPDTLAQFMPRRGGSGKGLGGLDGAAQAGIIRGMMLRLDANEQAMIAARFSAHDRESVQARLFLVPVAIAALPTGLHNRRAVDSMVQKFFGFKIGVQGVADNAGVHRNTISPQWREIRACLNALWERAEERAHIILQESQIIP